MFRAHQGRCRSRPRGSAGGGPAGRRCASPPRPAPLAGAASHPLPRWAGDGGGRRGSARRAARPPPGPARRAGGCPAARHARPAPPRWPGRCPSAQLEGPAAALCRSGRAGAGGGGEDRWGGSGGGGMRYGWPAARPGIRPAAGRGPGLACSLSIAIESVQPGFRSDSLNNMQNMLRICRMYNEICGICNKICTIICRI